MLKSNNKIYTLEEATKKMEHYCVYQERCHYEIERKLREIGMFKEAKESILLHLIENDYLNEERFSRAFARGKFKIKKWGKNRIRRELGSRNISVYNIKIALAQIEEEEYLTTFEELAQKRLQALSEANKYKKRKKLADYLLYRGWESDLVYKKVTGLIP